MTRLVNPGVERIDQFGNLVAACGIDGIDAEPAVDHMIYGMSVYIRQNLDPLVERLDSFGTVTQTF